MISVVIPLYNKELSIDNTIKSVLNQTYQDFEIVVVNDGSTDNSIKIVEHINDPRIRIIDKLNGGVSSARNRGIEEAQYEWVAFLDGDDLWEEDYLLEMHKLIIDFPECVIYGSSYFVKIDGAKSVQQNMFNEDFRGVLENFYSIAIHGLLYWTSSTIINKDKLEGIMFDERISLGEDLDFWLRVIEKGTAVYYNKPLAIYNHDGPNRAMNKKHDIEKNFIFYSDKYSQLEKNSKDFKKLINLIRIGKIPEVFLSSNATKTQMKYYLSMIDYADQAKRHLYFSYLPFTLKRIVVSLKYKKEFT